MALNTKKLDELILRLGRSPHIESLGKTKLWKLIYFIDVEFLREFGRTITGSEYIKYDHGPVPSRGEKRLKVLKNNNLVSVDFVDYGGYAQHHIASKSEATENQFTQEELDVVNKVCLKYGSDTATYLSELSHKEPAWVNAQKMEKLSGELMFYGNSEDEDGL